MPNLMVENKRLREEREQMESELAELRASGNGQGLEDSKYRNLPEEEDGRGTLVDIVYRNQNAPDNARGGAKFISECLPLRDAYQKLVTFYSSFPRATDRNIPKDFWNGARPEQCNQAVCYVKHTYTDKTSSQIIQNLRKEVPLWLAVDLAVQQDHQVTLISKKEYDDYMDVIIKDELRRERVFQERKRAKALDQLIREEAS